MLRSDAQIARIEAAVRRSASGAGGVPAGWQFPALGSSPAASGFLVNQQSAMGVSAVYACVKIIASDIAKLRPTLYRRLGADRRQVVTDHPVAAILRRPNRVQTWYDFARMQTAAILLRGNAFTPIVRLRDGTPKELIPVNPDRIMVLEAVDGEIYYNVSRYGLWEMDALRTLPLAVPQNDCLHLKNIGATALLGSSPITLARETIGLAIAQEQHSAQMFGNGAKPSGVLSTDRRLSDDSAKRLKQRWNDAHQGPNAGGTAVLEEGLKWQQISLSSVDTEFLNQRKFSVEEIARIYRVPIHMLQVMERATFNNIEQQHQAYLSDTLSDYIEMWTQGIDTHFGLDEQDLFVELDTTKLLRNDTLARYNSYRLGIMSGFIKINEARVAEGFAPEPGGDELIRPLNMQPLTQASTGAGADNVPDPGGGDQPAGGPPGSDMSGAPAEGGDGDPAGATGR